MICWPISSILLLKGWVHNAHYSKETLLPMSGPIIHTWTPPNYLDGPIRYLFTCEPPNYLDGPIRYLFTCETPNYLDGHPPQAIKRVGLSWKHTLNCWSYSFLTTNSSWGQRVNKVCICLQLWLLPLNAQNSYFDMEKNPIVLCVVLLWWWWAGFCTRLDEEHAKCSTLCYQYFDDKVVNV